MSKKFSEKWREEKEAKKRKRLEKDGSIKPDADVGKGLDQVMKKEQQIDLATLRDKHLFIATPAYGGLVGEAYLKAMVKVGIMFKQYNLNFTLCTIANESLITRGRNTLTAMFMSDPKFTDMMFIDADIHFEAESVLKLWAHINNPNNPKVEVAIGSYPKKSINWPQIYQAVKKGATPDEMQLHQGSYVLNIRTDDKGRIPLQDGLIPVYDGGTGFMMYKKQVIQRMFDKWPELHYKNDLNTDPKHDPYMYALFDTLIDPKTRRYLSEDYTFCRRYQELGGQIWMDPSINLDHQGNYLFKGNIANQFTYSGEATSDEMKDINKQMENNISPTPNEANPEGTPGDDTKF
ncbi:MAG: hypothetical protein CMA64_07605 [Euryarchaeota archaeon]|nr:hypothetical protein [Euryarchaeota archaeon]